MNSILNFIILKYVVNCLCYFVSRGQSHFILLMSFALLTTACSSEEKNPASKIISAERHNLARSLFYTGTIKPIKMVVIPSPADGVIVDIPFEYGQEIKENQLLFVISSAKFLTDYKAALLQFIKTKSEFNNSQTQLKEAQFLHKNQLISDDEFHSKQSNFYGNRLALLQAKDALEILTKQFGIKNQNVYELNAADIDNINKALHLNNHSENLRILSPTHGVILSATKNEEETKKVLKGDAIKQGDVLAIVGDMSGLSVAIKVNELAINQIKVGQRVKITGIAFPNHILEGKITRIDHQGELSNGSLPNFSAEIQVAHLTEKQRNEIHSGMSAKIEILISEEAQILVPITALLEKQGVSYLKIYDSKLKQNRLVVVKTGKTSIDNVAILSGIKIGDKIVVPN